MRVGPARLVFGQDRSDDALAIPVCPSSILGRCAGDLFRSAAVSGAARTGLPWRFDGPRVLSVALFADRPDRLAPKRWRRWGTSSSRLLHCCAPAMDAGFRLDSGLPQASLVGAVSAHFGRSRLCFQPGHQPDGESVRYGGGRRVTVAKTWARGVRSKPKLTRPRSVPASRARRPPAGPGARPKSHKRDPDHRSVIQVTAARAFVA